MRNFLIATLFAFSASTALATGGHNPPAPPKPPTHPPAQSVDIGQKMAVSVGVKTHTSSEAKASAGATSGSHSSATGGNASATGGHSNASVGNVSGGHSSASTGPVTATGGQGGAGGTSTSTSSATGGQGGAGGSVGNIDAGSGNGNSVNIGGDTYKAPANAPAAQFLPPLVCGDRATGGGVQGMNWGFNLSFGGSRERCFETTEAAACVNGAIAIGHAFGRSLKIADAAIHCLAQMPAFKDAAKAAGLEPVKMAREMVNDLATLGNTEKDKEIEQLRAQAIAAANASNAEKNRANQLATELEATQKRAEVATRLLNEERAKPPRVIYRDRPAPPPPCCVLPQPVKQ